MLDNVQKGLPGRPSLKRRVLNAGAWSLAGYTLSQAIRFGGNLAMTRLLAPDMYGVMAVAATVMTGLAMFVDLGLKPHVVQGRDSEPIFLNTAWVTQIVQGVMISVGAMCIAALVLLANRSGFAPQGSVY